MKTNAQKKAGMILAAIAVLGLAFGGGFFLGKNQQSLSRITGVYNQGVPTLGNDFEGVDFGLFWNVWGRLQDKFVDKDKLDKQKMVYGAISGLVNSLGDPYTVFLPPQQSKDFKDEIKGSFGGIGAEIGIRKGILTIIAPLKDSPAEKAGIKAKDQILKINATSTAELSLEEAVHFIRGPKGTEVKLFIMRDAFDAPKEFSITRDDIKIPTISYESKGQGIYYIALYNFNEVSGLQFREALQAFFRSGDKKLILDLRNNPGGFLNIAVDIASFFSPAGTPIVKEIYHDKSEDVYRSAGYNLLQQVPTVVIVNSGSASASEILAGALRDNNAIPLVGEKTFGKGSVQELINLPQNASVKITIARWVTPAGTIINGNGLEPDVTVTIPEKPEEDRDYFLEKAIEILKNK